MTEGEDKPLKYPEMFRAARLMLLNKYDLLPHLRFDVAQVIANTRRVNPDIAILQVSAETGGEWTPGSTGFTASWPLWPPAGRSVTALKKRVAELETQLLSLRASRVE